MSKLNATISAQKDGSPADAVPVDVNGDFGKQLAEGNYKITIGAVGYMELVFEMDLKLSSVKTLNVKLVKFKKYFYLKYKTIFLESIKSPDIQLL